MFDRFHALIVVIARVRSASFFSLKCLPTSLYHSSGTWVSAAFITAAVPVRARAFAIGVERSLLPGIQCVQAVIRLSNKFQIFPMHIKTISAPVDLRGAEFDQMKQGLFPSALVKLALQTKHSPRYLRSHF